MAVEIYPIKEAADILGITEKAMRARAQRGSVSSQKVGGRWTIALDPEDFRKEAKRAK